MAPRLWQAIDQIGVRPASRFEWKLASSLDWADLEPFLTVCPGRAGSVPDPADPLETLIVWPRNDGTAFLESSHIPAHREPIPVPGEDLRLYRADVNALGRELAVRFNFTAQPGNDPGPVFRVGIVQTKAEPQVAVLPFVPRSDPVASVAALQSVAASDERTLLLLPSARWLRPLSSLKHSLQVKTVFEYLSKNDEDNLVAVVAKSSPRRSPKSKPCEIIQVRTDDRWKDVKMVLDPTSGRLRISIGHRSVDITVWEPKRRSRRQDKAAASRFAEILGRVAISSPQMWSISSIKESEQETMRRAFQLLKKRLADWVPIADGEPFEYDRETRSHRPRFSLEMKKCA